MVYYFGKYLMAFQLRYSQCLLLYEMGLVRKYL